jgi:ATP-dependent Lon protease
MEKNAISSKMTDSNSRESSLLAGESVSFLLKQPKNELLATLLFSAFQPERKGPRYPSQPPADAPLGSAAIFDPKSAERQWASKSSGKSSEANQLQLEILRDMASESGLRNLSEMAIPTWKAELSSRFPHFKEVVEFIERNLAVNACGTEGAPFKIPPILLRGAPGVGKTYFAQELARLAGTEFFERDLSVLSEAFVLTGLDSSWRGAKPGLIFDALVRSKVANPLVLLNEVDKIQTSQKSSPLAALYALLEPTSSSSFVDEFVPVPIDASNVGWILTANEGEIPAAIMSRLEVFDIPLPTEDQMLSVAASVWTNVCLRQLPKGHPFKEVLPYDILGRFAQHEPREMRKAMVRAVGDCVLNGSFEITHESLDRVLGKRHKERRTIGFV